MQNRGSMNKNRLSGAKGGRAGLWPRSPYRSKPGSVETAIVRGKGWGLSGEICAVPWREPGLGLPRGRPIAAQKSAKGVVAMKAG